MGVPTVTDLVAALHRAQAETDATRDLTISARESVAEAHAELLACWNGSARTEAAAALAALLRSSEHLARAAAAITASQAAIDRYVAGALGVPGERTPASPQRVRPGP